MFGHCAGLARRSTFDRKTARAVGEAMKRHLDQDDYPQLRATFGDDPVEAFVKSSGFMTDDSHFDIGIEALLDGFAKRFKLK